MDTERLKALLQTYFRGKSKNKKGSRCEPFAFLPLDFAICSQNTKFEKAKCAH